MLAYAETAKEERGSAEAILFGPFLQSSHLLTFPDL